MGKLVCIGGGEIPRINGVRIDFGHESVEML